MHGLSLRRLSPVAAVLTLAACADSAVAPRDRAPVVARGDDGGAAGEAGQPIPGRYIVVFRDGVPDVRGKAAEMARRAGGEVTQVYERALRGFAGPMSASAAALLRQDPDVAYVEQDQVVTLDATQTPVPSWGLDRVDQTALPLSGGYTYEKTGAGVVAYIIDTGVRATHQDFGGRATNAFDAVGDGTTVDCNGHGTHVAGTVGGNTYGVAKGVTIRAIRVFSCSGSSATSTIVSGVDWAVGNHQAGEPAVANLSLGGGASQAMDDAVTRLINDGVFTAVAAGNGNIFGIAQDACNYSPARVAAATTVAATTSTDAKASYSNFGRCVDLYAPGSGITSAWWDGDAAKNTISGTSMAAPHVAGVGALYLQGTPSASPATVGSWITNNATSGVVSGNPRRTANLLLNKRSL